MKNTDKTILRSVTAFSALLLAACDPGYNDYLYIDNQSGQDVVVEYAGNYRYYPGPDERGYDGTYPAPDGEKTLLFSDGGIGCTSKEYAEQSIRHLFLGDSISFVFNDGRRITYYPSDTLSESSPYNFGSPNYTYTQKSPANRSCSISQTAHTYTLRHIE